MIDDQATRPWNFSGVQYTQGCLDKWPARRIGLGKICVGMPRCRRTAYVQPRTIPKQPGVTSRSLTLLTQVSLQGCTACETTPDSTRLATKLGMYCITACSLYSPFEKLAAAVAAWAEACVTISVRLRGIEAYPCSLR